MAAIPSQNKPSLGKVLVIGGCGFLGHHIVNLLYSSYSASISVVDLRTTRNRRPESDGVQYFDGDITSTESLVSIFEKVRPDVVIHTASPTLMDASRALYYKVNVEGTRCVVEACQKTNVKALVYTSSASIVSDNTSDLINADERWPVLTGKLQTEYYSDTKAEAEALVLSANRAPGTALLTCSIRPAGIIGEGDVQLVPRMLDVYKSGKTGFQLGNNENMFDFTYVGNVAHGHLLAASALLTTASTTTIPLSHERVDGEAFFITNDSPIYFWDFPRMVWRAAGSTQGTEHVWVIGKETGMALAGAIEWVMWCIRKTPSLTKRQVRYSCMTRYYDISKAKKRLGYAPIVSLEEGVERSVKWFMAQETQEAAKKTQ